VLNDTARAICGLGMRAVFHHHAGTYVETPEEVDLLMELTDPELLGLCFDTGHYYYGGGDPVEAARKHSARIWHLHLKDVNPAVLDEVRHEKVGFVNAVQRGVFCELGAGGVDVVGSVCALRDAGFDGWAVFEQDVDPTQPGVHPIESATRSRAYVRQTLGI
jgi:inosose dehydratase